MNVKIATNSLLLTVARVLSMLIMILYFMILSRFLTLKEYGTFNQILLVSNLATIVFGLGLSSSVNYFMAKEDSIKGKSKFLSIFYTFTILISFIIGIFLFYFDFLFAKYFKNEELILYSFAFFVLPFSIISKSSFDNILIVSNKIKNLFLFKSFYSSLLLLTVTLNFILKSSFKTFLLLYITIELFVSILFFLYVHFFIVKFRFEVDFKMFKDILKFSIPLGLATAVSTINIQLDKFLIGRFFDTERLAIYTNGSKEMPVTIISFSLVSILMPIVVKEIKKNNKKLVLDLWNKTNELSLIIISYFVIIFLVFTPEVITILYSEKYIESVPIFRIYTLVLFLKFTYFGMILNASGKTKFIFYSSLISLFLNFILNLLFIKLFGFNGPAIATFISLLIVAYFQLYYTSKILNLTLLKLFSWGEIIKLLSLALLFSIILEFLKIFILKFKVNNYFVFLFLLLLSCFLYFFIIFRKKILNSWKYLNSYKEESKYESIV